MHGRTGSFGVRKRDVMRPHLLVKKPQFLVFVWDCHALQVLMVSHGLKVTANEEKIDLALMAGFELVDMTVDGIEFAVAASFHCNLLCNDGISIFNDDGSSRGAIPSSYQYSSRGGGQGVRGG